jgi:DNA-directed RNA polymerase specialized sigma24 family protein
LNGSEGRANVSDDARGEPHEPLSQHVFKYVEGELYDYDQKRRRARYMRASITRAESPIRRSGRPDGHPDPTFSAVANQELAVELNPKLALLEERIKQIRDGYEGLPRDGRLLVQLKYFQGNSNELTAQQLRMSRRAFFRYRRDVVEHFAHKFGLA